MKKSRIYVVAGFVVNTLCSLNALSQTPGSLDPSFSTDGKRLIYIGIYGDDGIDVAVQPDGKIVIAGTSNDCDVSASPPVNIYNYGVTRILSDGNSDNTFGSFGKLKTDFNVSDDRVTGVVLESGTGKIIVSGQTADTTGGVVSVMFSLARYNINGDLDNTFGTNGKSLIPLGISCSGGSMVLQPDGKILIGGFTLLNGNYVPVVARYLNNGTIDMTFNNSGRVVIPFAAGISAIPSSMILQPDGKMLLIGSVSDNNDFLTSDMLLIRLQADGTLDNSFGTNGITRTVISGTGEFISGMALQPDGKIVVSGSRTPVDTQSQDFLLARYNVNGTPDVSFGAGGSGIVTGEFLTNSRSRAGRLIFQPDGKIIIGGLVATTPNNYDFGLARFSAEGIIDNSFGNNGIVITDMGGSEYLASMEIQQDGKLLAVGRSDQGFANHAFAVARYIIGASGLGLNETSNYVSTFSVSPNPATDHMTVSYHLSQETAVKIHLCDISGRYVTQLKQSSSELSGDHEQFISFPAEVQAGCYYVVLTAGTTQQVERIVVTN